MKLQFDANQDFQLAAITAATGQRPSAQNDGFMMM